MASARERLSQSRDMRQCPGCQATVTLADAIDEHAAAANDIEVRMSALEVRQSHAEIEHARLSAVVEGIPRLIDAHLSEFRGLLKARDSVIRADQSGRDVTNSTPPGSSTLKLPGGTSWRGPSAIVAAVIMLSVMFATLVAGAGATAYFVVKSQTSAIKN